MIDGQAEAEGRPWSGGIFIQPDCAGVSLDDFLADGEAQPGAGFTAGGATAQFLERFKSEWIGL
jgi:hypothetical protein